MMEKLAPPKIPDPLRAATVVNVGLRLSETARQDPDGMAVAMPRGRDAAGKRIYQTLTFRQLDDDSNLLADGLSAMGVRPGTRLVLMVPPSIDFISLVFAMFKAGVVTVLIDPGMGRRNLVRCLAESDPEGFVGIPLAHAVRAVLRSCFPKAVHNVTVGRRWFWGGRTIAQLRRRQLSAGFRPVATKADDPAAIIFTTGSTGPPKGVLYRHGNFNRQADEIRDFYAIQPGEIDLPGFPLFALFNSAMGVSTVIPDMDPTRPAKVDPRNIVEAVRDWNVTQAFGSPALWNVVGRHCEANQIVLPTLRRVLSAGAPVPPHVLKRMKAAIAADGDVERLLCPLQVALGHDPVGGGGPNTQADLDAGRKQGAGFRRIGADAANVLVEQVLELGALALVAGGPQVGDVVRDNLDVELLRQHAGGGYVQGFHRSILHSGRGARAARPFLNSSGLQPSELLDCALTQVVGAVEQLGRADVRPRHLDHAGDLGDRMNVRLLDHPLGHPRMGGRLGLFVAGKKGVAHLAHALLVVERDDPQPRLFTVLGRDRAVGGDGQIGFLRREQDRAAKAENRIAVGGGQAAFSVDLEMTIASVALAVRGLDHQPALAVDGDVQRVAGGDHVALAEVADLARLMDVGNLPVRAAHAVDLRNRHDELLELEAVALVPGGLEVRQVVGDGVHLVLQGHLARQAYEKCVLHGFPMVKVCAVP